MDVAKSCFFPPWRSFLLEQCGRGGTPPLIPAPLLLRKYRHNNAASLPSYLYGFLSMYFDTDFTYFQGAWW